MYSKYSAIALTTIIDNSGSALLTILYLIHLVINSHIDPKRRNAKIVSGNLKFFNSFYLRVLTRIIIIVTLKAKIETLIELSVNTQS